MKMTGIIFSNIYDHAMGALTAKRTVASLPFGGRYRQIDFVLSNMVNSNINNIGVITKYNYQSLMDHLGSCTEWDLNRKNSRLVILPPFVSGNTGLYKGKLEALYTAISFLERYGAEYVLLSDSTTICNIDYERILKEHIKSGKDITAVVQKIKEDTIREYDLVIEADEDLNPVSLAVGIKPRSGQYAALGMYVMRTKELIEVIRDSVARGLCYLEKEFIQKQFNMGKLTANISEFTGSVLINNSIQSYYENSLKLMDENVRNDLFSPDNPIYTKVRDEFPTLYEKGSLVNDCLVADGCEISGTAENCIIFRDVKIKKGAVVTNSIVMQGTVIGEDSSINCAILDKDVTVSPGTRLMGVTVSPIIIQKGERI